MAIDLSWPRGGPGRGRNRRGHLVASTVLMAGAAVAGVAPVDAAPGDVAIVHEQAELTPSTTVGNAEFGHSVAVDGDLAIVGDYLNGGGGGAAYVYERLDAAWTQTGIVLLNDAIPGDITNFARSVAASGGLVAAGATGRDTAAGPDAGAVQVFEKRLNGWFLQAELNASDAAPYTRLGRSVAMEGDTLVAGADGSAGSVYIFTRDGQTWSEQAKLTAPDAGSVDLFGRAVAISGDVVVVGAWGDDTANGANAGSAYVFVRSGPDWVLDAHLQASDGSENDLFGEAVDVSGDTVVGARNADVGGLSGAGSAYVFVRTDAGWSQQVRLTSPEPGSSDGFGDGVAVSGDGLVIGAPGQGTTTGPFAGAAYSYVRSEQAWGEPVLVRPADNEHGDNFGAAVAASGDTAIIGAPNADVAPESSSGVAYAFVAAPIETTLEVDQAAAPGPGGRLIVSGAVTCRAERPFTVVLVGGPGPAPWHGQGERDVHRGGAGVRGRRAGRSRPLRDRAGRGLRHGPRRRHRADGDRDLPLDHRRSVTTSGAIGRARSGRSADRLGASRRGRAQPRAEARTAATSARSWSASSAAERNRTCSRTHPSTSTRAASP